MTFFYNNHKTNRPLDKNCKLGYNFFNKEVSYETFYLSIFISIGLFLTPISLHPDAKSINHNGVIIGAWAGGTSSGNSDNQFWTDAFLFYELLWKYGKFSLYCDTTDDHIHMLWGYGVDWEYRNDRYDAYEQFGVSHIVDDAATEANVESVLTYLAYGGNGIEPMTDNDNLFLAVHAHGRPTGVPSEKNEDDTAYINLNAFTDFIMDDTLGYYLDKISCNKKVIIMQNCCSGGFINELENAHTVIATSAGYGSGWNDPMGVAMVCADKNPDGSPADENEYISESPEVVMHHGEFSFHMYNAFRQSKVWTSSNGYDNPPPVFPDDNGDLLVSFQEAYNYQYDSTSDRIEGQRKCHYSDIGNIGSSTFLAWDDYTAPQSPSNLRNRLPRYISSSKAVISLMWDANTEQDLAGYYIYRRILGGNWEYIKGRRTNSYDDTVDVGNTYWYYVKAVDIAKNISPSSNVIQVYVDDAVPKYQMEGGSSIASVYTIKRDGIKVWGEYPEYKADYGNELEYRFDGINPDSTYRIGLIYYSKGINIREKIMINGKSIGIITASSIPHFRIINLTGLNSSRGINVRIRPLNNGYAVISKIVILEKANSISSLSFGSPFSLNNKGVDISNTGIDRNEEYVDIKIIDITGRVVKRARIHPSQAIDTEGFKRGVYLMIINTPSRKRITKKFIVL